MNTLSALQYLKVCLSHMEFEVESTYMYSYYAALSVQIKRSDADGPRNSSVRGGPGESPGGGGYDFDFGIRMRR